MNSIKAYMVAKAVVMAGIFMYVIAHFYPGYNLLSRISTSNADVAVAIIGVCTIYVAMQRRTYLPFLDRMAMPSSILAPINLAEKNFANAGASKVSVDVKAPEARYIVWWAAEPKVQKGEEADGVLRPREAYGEMRNAGVAEVINGAAKIDMYCPRTYNVGPLRTRLAQHVHYREALPNGMFSQVKTIKVRC